MFKAVRDMFLQWRRHKGAFGLISGLIAKNRKGIIFLTVFGGIGSAIAVICSYFVREMIDAAGTGTDKTNLIIYGIIITVSCLCDFILSYYRKRIGEEMYRQTERSFFKSALYSEWMNISEFQTGDLMTRMEDDGGQLVGFAANVYPGVIVSFIKLIIVIPIIASVSLIMPVYLLLMAFVSALLMGFIRAKMLPLQKKAREEEAETTAYTNESFSNLLTIRSLGKEEYFLKKWDSRVKKRIAAVNKRNDTEARAGLLFDILSSSCYFVVFAWTLFMLGDDNITYGTLSMLLVLQGYVQGPVTSIVESVPQLIWTSVSASRMNEVIGSAQADNIHPGDVIEDGAIGIHADNISFSYGSKKIFDGFSFDIAPGEFVTLEGASGSGKTTLLMLLLDMLHPCDGSIKMYNAEGKSAALNSEMRTQIGYVPQKNTLFKGTIRENVCLCLKDGSEADDDTIMRALYLADAKDFVTALENGIDTAIGERGRGLSEGQAQRLAIARALMLRPKLLIFDEATSALDNRTEAVILERISAMPDRPTVIFATHRKAADRFADRTLDISG